MLEWEAPEVEAPLRLSDLMRQGASMAEQAIGEWKSDEGFTCALSAAKKGAEALGVL